MWNHLLTHKVKERRLIGAKGSQERFSQTMGFPGGSAVKNSPANSGDMSLIPWRREWQPSPVFLPGKSNEWKSLAGPNLWDCKESDMTEQLTHSLKAECIYLPQRYAATKGRARVHPCSIDSQTQALCTLSGLFLQPSSPEAIDRV